MSGQGVYGAVCLSLMLQTLRPSLLRGLILGLEKPQQKSHQEVSFPLSSRLIRNGSSPRVQEMKQEHYMLLTEASLSCTGPLGVGQETVPVWQSSDQGVGPGQPGMRHAIL